MEDSHPYPPEVRLLAEMARLGERARRLLARSHLLAALHEAPAEAPAPASPGPARQGAPMEGGPAAPDGAAQAARLLLRFWAEQPPLPTLQRYGEPLDVDDPEGRWQLLALAVLLAAPVPREAAEATFCRLRREGLLSLDRAAGEEPGWAEAVDAVMEAAYRGRADRRLQRQRLQAAARTLRSRWGGDLDRVWREAGGDPEQAVGLLRRELKGIDRMAAWLVREMGRLGRWPRAHRHPAAFFADAGLREAAANLGMMPVQGAPGSRRRLESALQEVVARHFGGDSTVLSSQGRALCSARQAAVCLSRCPVSRYCRAWDPTRRPDTGEEAGGRSTGS